MTANPKKCKLGFKEVEYLGYLIGRGNVKPQERKVHAVRDWPIPRTKTRVKSFLGLAGYCSRFIPNFAAIASPLTDLTRARLPKTMKWTDETGAPEGSTVLTSDSRNARFPGTNVGPDGCM